VPTKLIALGFRIAGLVTMDTLEPPRLADPCMKIDTVMGVPTVVKKLGGVVPQLVADDETRAQTVPPPPPVVPPPTVTMLDVAELPLKFESPP
jgi:hypothetical protein